MSDGACPAVTEAPGEGDLGATVALLSAAFLLLPPVAALAGTNLNVAIGWFGSSARLHTVGEGTRDYVRVWHVAGDNQRWAVYYYHCVPGSGCTVIGYTENTSNPTQNTNGAYGYAYCFNMTDNSNNADWTCQTTTA